ncbi:MAG: hypothetical protein KDA87_24075, partial [Planctomycetales bacterium]|nr:hypothetical protein [Planctomycetales bacterium]
MIRVFVTLMMLLNVCCVSSVVAQSGQFSVLPEFGGIGAGGNEIQVSANLTSDADGSNGKLQVTAVLGPRHYTYSQNQKREGGLPTKINIQRHDAIVSIGKFQPDHPPKMEQSEYTDATLEKFTGVVTWTAPVQFVDGAKLDAIQISGNLDGQVCEEGGVCLQMKNLGTDFTARLKINDASSSSNVANATGSNAADSTATNEANLLGGLDNLLAMAPAKVSKAAFRPKRAHAGIEGQLSVASVKPGDKFHLQITVAPDEPYHIYDYA